MVETNRIVARIIRVTHIEYADTIVEHLEKRSLLTTENISRGDSRAHPQIGHN